MKIYVIMASYLGEYSPTAAKHRVKKFHRAVQSFLDQFNINRHLIVVSDGCNQTNKAIKELHKYYPPDDKVSISLIKLRKQKPFSGAIRNAGLEEIIRRQEEDAWVKWAKDDVVCYLDTDDYFLPGHLDFIKNSFEENKNIEWGYYNDLVATKEPTGDSIHSMISRIRDNKLEFGRIGTSAIAHKLFVDSKVRWPDGYGHDWEFIKKLINTNSNFCKLGNGRYLVCHIPGVVDF